MFNDEILEKIFSDKRTYDVPIVYQTIMIKVIEEIIEAQNENDNRHGRSEYLDRN